MVDAATGATRVTWKSLFSSRGIADAFERLSALSMQAINRYGLAYNMSSRLLGVVVVAGLFALLKQGVDVQGWLEEKGYGKVGEQIGEWAGAVVTAALLYPFTVVMAGAAAPIVGRALRSGMRR